MKPNSSVLFLTLNTFSLTGGIEKVCRVAGKALFEICEENNSKLLIYSLYDRTNSSIDNKYFPSENFKGFSGNIFQFITSSLLAKSKTNKIVIMSHVNLLIVGYLIKLFSPKTRLLLIAHGIEIWPPLSNRKKFMLKKCDEILAVSNFTKKQILQSDNGHAFKIYVLNNCLDPFLPTINLENVSRLKARYKILETDIIMLAVTRYSSHEKYKGYDHVINILPFLVQDFPNLKYLLVGKYDNEEYNRILNLGKEKKVSNHLIFTGFVSDEELADHFGLASFFVMPSEKEGFGLVFIEALFYGLYVIAGNQDGTQDALLKGKLGKLVKPGNDEMLIEAIKSALHVEYNSKKSQNLVLENFGFEKYKSNWNIILSKN